MLQPSSRSKINLTILTSTSRALLGHISKSSIILSDFRMTLPLEDKPKAPDLMGGKHPHKPNLLSQISVVRVPAQTMMMNPMP